MQNAPEGVVTGGKGCRAARTEPYKIGVATRFDFRAKNLTPYGSLFPVATMWEMLGFQELVEETVTIPRTPRVMTIYQFFVTGRGLIKFVPPLVIEKDALLEVVAVFGEVMDEVLK